MEFSPGALVQLHLNLSSEQTITMEFFPCFLPSSFAFNYSLNSWSWPLVICLFCLFLLSLISLHSKHKSQAIDFWLFLGTFPSLVKNSNRFPEWFTEVFISVGKGSFYIDGPVFSKLSYLVTCHHQNIEYIVKTNFNNFPKGPDFKQVFDVMGDGIFTVDAEPWHLQRTMAHAAFTSGEFKTLVANMSRKEVEEQLIPFLAHVAETGSTVDIEEVFSRFAFDSSIVTTFGRHERYLSLELPSNELAEAMDVGLVSLVYRHAMPMFLWKLLRWLKVGMERKLSKALQTVDVLLQGYISQKREDLLKGVGTVDLLSSYINYDRRDNLIKSDEFLRDSMLSLLLAGRDTITSGLTWFFWLLSKSQSAETKILEELKQLVRFTKKNKSSKVLEDETKWPQMFDSDDLKGLVYLHAALCETLRLYPPIPLNSKSVTKEDVLPDGSLVKPGMQIILSIYSVGRMPWIWGEDCLEFKPERWIDENGRLSFKPMSKFFAFNVGPRSCIGKDIAFTQMKSVAAVLIFNFHVEVIEGQHVCPKPSIVLHTKNGLKVKITKRVIH